MEPIVTTELPAPVPQREPTDAEIEAAKEVLAQLEAEARALGAAEAAGPLLHAMGRIWIEQLGDEKNAAVCYQNAYFLNPKYRPNLEAARRLFASAGRYEKALALHQLEEAMLDDPAHRAESLRAQAMLARELGRADEARKLIDRALQLAPEHPALLNAAVATAQRPEVGGGAVIAATRDAAAASPPGPRIPPGGEGGSTSRRGVAGHYSREERSSRLEPTRTCRRPTRLHDELILSVVLSSLIS